MAAIQERVPIQCRILPSASAAAEGGGESEESAYESVFKDLVRVLAEMRSETALRLNDGDGDERDVDEEGNAAGGGGGGSGGGGGGGLRIHLGCWSGTCDHMLLLLKAFPDTVYIGMNGSVGYAKSTIAHACAFDVPLDRLLLETDAPLATPAPVVSALGRAAYCHSGLVPFVAAAVSEHKKAADVTAVDVARASSENTARLYGKGVAARAAQAAAEAAAATAAAAAKLAEEEAAAAAAAATAEAEADAAAAARLQAAEEEGGQEASGKRKKKKTKKKNRGGPDGLPNEQDVEKRGGDGGGNADADFDKKYFTSAAGDANEEDN